MRRKARDRTALLTAINERLDRFARAGDVAAVTGDAALREAGELARADDGDLAVAHALATFYLHRARADTAASGSSADDTEAAAAMYYWQTLFHRAPELLDPGLFDQLAGVLPVGPELLARWNDRATRLVATGRRARNLDLVDDAVRILRAIRDAEAGDPPADHRAGHLTNLGLALRVRFQLTRQPEDIADALAVGGEAVAAAHSADVRHRARSNLAISHTARYERYGEPADLDAAVAELERATERGTIGAAGPIANLAAALASRFVLRGDLGDVDRAIALLGTVLESVTEPVQRSEVLSNRSGAHSLRYSYRGDTTDLDLAVDDAREAQRTAGAQTLPETVNNLALSLRSRYQQTEQADDIDDAIGLLRDVVAQLPDGPERARYRSNLCSALRVRFDRTHQPADIEDAVRAGRAAAYAADTDPGTRARYLSNLSAALSRRFSADHDRADLVDAVTAGSTALGLLAPDDPIRATVLANLGLALRRLARHDGDAGALVRAAQAYEDSAGTSGAPPLVRATSAQDAGDARTELGEHDRALSAYEIAVGLLATVTDSRLRTPDQRRHLLRLSGLGSAAAAAALEDDPTDPARALALLERGRGVLLGRLLTAHDDLADLADHHPSLAAEVDRLQWALTVPDAPPEIAADRPQRRRAWQLQEQERLLRRVRDLPRFGSFLLPAKSEPAAPVSPVRGPVVAVNLAERRCDALVVTSAGVQLLPLPKLSRQEAMERANSFLAAVQDPGRDDDRITDVLEWMWTTFARDVLDRLGLTRTYGPSDTPPRLWWLPTGALTVLPIHAAGAGGTGVLDRVVSSYTPTLRALQDDGGDEPLRPPERALVVAVPDGPRPLPAARDELTAVLDRLPSGARSLVGPEAGHDQVLRELAGSDWVHFACHADADADDPFDSHLALHDRPLLVREIAALRIRNGQLAYLSACTTAFGGTDLYDEGIHVSSAFRLAGYRHVLGTLWEVLDPVARRMAEHVYPNLVSASPAHAGHRSTLELRRRYPRRPHLWAPYVHIGR